MDTTGKNGNRGLNGSDVRPGEHDVTPDEHDATPLGLTETDSPASDSEAGGTISALPDDIVVDDDAVVVVEDGDETGAADPSADDAQDESLEGTEGDEQAAPGRMDKVRALASIRFDSDRLRAAWHSHSLGRIALLCVVFYALFVGASYFLVMQPVNRKMHMVKEQKSLLHDYIVIQQAGAAIGDFKDGLMTGDQRLTVMSEVNLMAEGSGVRVLGDPELLLSRDISGHFVEYPVRLRIKGDFSEIGTFLSLLESSSRFVVVESVEIMSDVASASRESDATVLLTLAAWEG